MEGQETAAPERQEPKSKAEPKPRLPIEELAHTVDPWVHAGVCEAKRWRPGRTMTAAAYKRAVDAWLKGGIDGTQ